MNKLAQIPVAPSGGFDLPGNLGNGDQYNSAATTGSTLAQVISTAIGVMTAIAFIWFVILLFLGAIQYLTSGGDAKAVEGAMSKIRTALIGLVIVISAIFFIQLVGTIFGLEILNIQTTFTNLVGITGGAGGKATQLP